MKNFFAVLFISVVLFSLTGLGIASAFTQAPPVVTAPTPALAPCPAPAVLKKAAAKPVVVVAPTVRTTLPTVGWPDWAMWALAIAVVLLALVVAFLLGRITAPIQTQPQVVAPVVYVQPPDPQRIMRP